MRLLVARAVYQPLSSTPLPLTPSPHRSQLAPVTTHHQEQDDAEAGVQLEATQAGDLKAARIAHEALGKLLDAPGGAEVRELSSVKRGRGR